MGNLGKATSFVDPEGDGDVMPKLVDMLTKVIELLMFFASSTCKASPRGILYDLQLQTSMT